MGATPGPGRLEHLTTEQLARLLGVPEDGQVECSTVSEPALPKLSAAVLVPPALTLALLGLACLQVLPPLLAVLLGLGAMVWWVRQNDLYRPGWPAPESFEVRAVRADPEGLSLQVEGEWHRFGWDALGPIRPFGGRWLLMVGHYRVFLDETHGGPILRAAQAVRKRPLRSLRRPTDGVPDAALSLARMADGEVEAERGLSISEGEEHG